MAYLSVGGYSGDEHESRSGDDRPESDLGDKPLYVVEHLATFTVNKESGISFAADGMRKLLQLEKTTGIWSQKMQLCLDRQWVLIIDYETGNIMERFSVAQINDPTAFTSQDPMEIYNNILVFIVNGGNSTSRSEMHIFQCQSISAVHLVEDLKKLRNGKIVTQHREVLPQPQQFQPVNRQTSHQTNSPQINAQLHGLESQQRDPFSYNQETDSELGGINDETSSTSSEKYERDVTVLNHCFDDIEKFIARLQHAAAALRELEKRRRNRKSKKKDPGEGLLSMRTRPPTEKEFIDIFAKFKLSFNLLAKLKAHIHDPNAPELVHFLFTPLALIVDASHDTYYDHLPARVIKPLLTREAINLLVNCVTSKETELWRSLGDAWTIPRDQWKGNSGSYHPVFFDGWSPDYPVIDELDNTQTLTNMKKRIEVQHYSGGDFDYDQHQPDKIYNPPESPGLNNFSTRSDISIDSIERHGGDSNGNTNNILEINQTTKASGSGGPLIAPVALPISHSSSDTWLEDLQSKGAKIVQVTYPRTANNEKELTVVRGEYLEIMDDSRKWWKARNSRGQVAHVPHTIVTHHSYSETDRLNNQIFSQNYGKVNGRQSTNELIDRYTSEHDDASFSVQPTAATSVDWVRHKHLESRNFDVSSDEENVSSNVLTTAVISVSSKPQGVSKIKVPLSNGKEETTLPPPPPPMPPPAPTTGTNSASLSRTNTFNSRKSIAPNGTDDDMQAELKHVLTLFRDRRKLDIVKTPEIYIQQSSNSKDVESWLRAKGFSENVVKKLQGLNGNELFALKRRTLEDYCGADEGKRLASQITIQRNVSGYKTARSSELQAILAKARGKIEFTV